MARPKTYTDAERGALVVAAADAIADGGLDSLSLRAVAGVAGVSTTVIYSSFGSRDGLVAAVIDQANRSFSTAQDRVVSGVDAHADLRELGLAYRRWALANRSLYEVMFAGRVPPSLLDATDAAMQPLAGVLRRLAQAGRLVGGDVDVAAPCIWSAVHGSVSLELALWPSAPMAGGERYTVVLDAVERAWVRPVSAGMPQSST